MGFLDMIVLISAILIIQMGLNTAEILPPYYRYHHCLGGNYTNTSIYQTNLKFLLSSLSSNALSVNNGFYNATVGENPNSVYGLFLCRGDIPPKACQYCVKTSGEDVVSRCYSNKKEAIIWYDQCMIKYSNHYFFSIMELDPPAALSSPNSVPNPLQFNLVLGDLMDGLVKEAVFGKNASSSYFSSTKANGNATRMFASGEKNFTSVPDYIYGLVQCTPDISKADCLECLQESQQIIPNNCYGMGGCHILRPSCSLRFESTAFYQYNPPSIYTTTTDGSGGKPSSNRKQKYIYISTIAGGVLLLLSLVCAYLLRRNIRTKSKTNIFDKDEIASADSLQFDLGTIRVATNNFSYENKLGEGGFGAVYKGVLVDGQEIAVKRLSRNSGQGSQEFKNELVLLHKLQHRNLVRLFGFCLKGEEKLLIYEYVPNSSLDKYIFDPNKRENLDWEMRYKIIGGIARGLLYLHEDSRFRIIHRDLKTSNILLDREMNPKISDFGLAKLFAVDQTKGNTINIAGTFGYMAPEYVLHGLFSVKSDVFSFGVLLLEIVSGQNINSFCQSSGPSRYLLSYAWRHWREGTSLDLVDPTLTHSLSTDEVMRCIHIGLLCVQENVDNRPTMSSVVLMLNSSSLPLTSPSPPALMSESRTGPNAYGIESDSA